MNINAVREAFMTVAESFGVLVKRLKKIFEEIEVSVKEAQNYIDRKKRLRASWHTPKQIKGIQQVTIRKPRAVARSCLN
ncbi:hypothetical protein SFC08_14630 [Lysinibacillus halotolerans]